MKKVLVLLSAYEGEQFLQDQLRSLDAQEGVDVYLLVRDDGSPNRGTLDCVRSFRPERMKVDCIEGENVGFALSFSLLVKEAFEHYGLFDFYAFCDQDDVWLKDKLAVATGMLEAKASVSPPDTPLLYCSNATLTDQSLNPTGLFFRIPDRVRRDKPTALIQTGCIGCTAVFNDAALKMYATHLPKGPFYAHDFLMYQMCMYLGHVVYDSDPHILYRQHGTNQIGAKDFLGRMHARLDYRKHAGTLENQSRLFLDLYKEELSEEDIRTVSRLAFYRHSLRSKLALLFDKRIRYGSAESNFFYFLKILGGVL